MASLRVQEPIGLFGPFVKFDAIPFARLISSIHGRNGKKSYGVSALLLSQPLRITIGVPEMSAKIAENAPEGTEGSENEDKCGVHMGYIWVTFGLHLGYIWVTSGLHHRFDVIPTS